MTILQDSTELDSGFILDTDDKETLIASGMDLFDANYNKRLQSSTEEPGQQQEQPPQSVEQQQKPPPPVVTPEVLQPEVDPISLNRKDFKDKYGSKKGPGDTPFIWVDMDKWRFMPRGEERDEAEKAWRLKYYGTTEKGSGFIYGSGKPGATLTEDIASYANNTMEGLAAIGAGQIDFYLSDLPSLLTTKMGFGKIPKIIPEFDNPQHQAIREISSYIVPIILTRGAIMGQLKAAGIISASTPVLKGLLIGGAADITAGAAVDYTNSLSQEGHNLTGFLKESGVLGRFGTWVPEWLATNDSDSPDQKKWKTVFEGGSLSIVGSLLEGTAKLTKAGASTRNATQYVPQNETAVDYFKKRDAYNAANTVTTDNPIADSIQNGINRKEEALDELGELTLATKGDLNEPVLGVHSVFDDVETAIKTADPDGVVGATVDAARIQGNVHSANGRLGSIITEAALKYGLEADNLTKRVLIQGIVEHIATAGKYDVLVRGKKLSWKQIDDAGTALAETLLDPRMEPGLLKKVLNELKNDVDGIKNLNDVAYDGAFKAIKGYMNQFLDMDVQKAQAYVATSLSGQVSDLAESVRLGDGTPSISRAQEMILDRLEYLLVEKGLASYTRGSGLANINVWKRIRLLNDPKKLEEFATQAHEAHKASLASIVPESKKVIETLRIMSKEKPEFLRPLMLAYEHTDGNIDQMHKLNIWVQNKLGTFSKAFYDGMPEIPSAINRAAWSNIYNSALSAFGTPLRAGLGNLGGIIADPINMFTGALLSGDIPTLKRGFAAYTAATDTFQKANQHMGMVFRKAASDPYSVGYIVRDDYALKTEEALEVLESFAEAATKNGEDGPAYLVQLYKNQEALAAHPWLRFGANSMTALDGWTRAFKGNVESKFRAIDALNNSGKPITKESLSELSDTIYKNMFDESGFLTDPMVDYGAREIALNLDSELTNGLNTILARVPALKPWLMFPKTAQNMIGTFHKYSPASILAGDYNRIALKPLKDFSAPEIESILKSKNIPVDENAMEKFLELRARVKGKVAIGTMFAMTGVNMFASNRLRGNGHYDPQRQKVRRASGWEPRTYKGWDGKWYSYDGMGPLSDWLALTSDILDNFDLITNPMQEEWLNKVAFVLGSNITNKSVLGQLEPMNDVLAGNPAALARWGSSFANLTLPLGSQRAEWARLFSPQLKELNQEFGQLLANRIPFANTFLPDSYNYITGKQIRYPENVLVRLWNNYAPSFKMRGDDITKEEQFLIDIEYNSRPSFKTNNSGVKYTPTERSELASIVGQQGILREEIRKIMFDAQRSGFVKRLLDFRRAGGKTTGPNSVKTEEFDNIYYRLDAAHRRAINSAKEFLSNKEEVDMRQYDLNVNERDSKKGIIPILNMVK